MIAKNMVSMFLRSADCLAGRNTAEPRQHMTVYCIQRQDQKFDALIDQHFHQRLTGGFLFIIIQ